MPNIIDAHAHCGIQDDFPPQSIDDYLDHVGDSGISGAVMIPPVIEIYDRYNPDFEDNPRWCDRRRRANQYLIDLEDHSFRVFPFFFIWNDFAVEQLLPGHRGIKWHRHSDEPSYHYDDPRCMETIHEIRRRNMVVCLEEEWHYTLKFINELAPGVRIIIPHCGLLNGGYDGFCHSGIWEMPHIYTDTSLVPSDLVIDYVRRYGTERIMFGSDFPFGDPRGEFRKVMRMKLSDGEKEAIVGANVERLLYDSNRESG